MVFGSGGSEGSHRAGAWNCFFETASCLGVATTFGKGLFILSGVIYKQVVSNEELSAKCMRIMYV